MMWTTYSYRRSRAYCFALITLSFLCACAQRSNNDGYWLHGTVDAAMASDLGDAIAKGERHFYITSTGGNFAQAIAMGHMLKETRSTLVPSGVCRSACAYMLLIVDPSRPMADVHGTYLPRTNGTTDAGDALLRAIGRSDIADAWGHALNVPAHWPGDTRGAGDPFHN